MENRELTCICCPKGCQITLTLDNGNVVELTGNLCKRGDEYAKAETLNPVRVVTSTVRCTNGKMVAVKTINPIPKNKIFSCMRELAKVDLNSDVKIGDVILQNVANTGVDIVATQNS